MLMPTLYNNLWLMLEDITEYVRATRQHLRGADDPRGRRFGFRAINGGGYWQIGLEDLRASIRGGNITQEQCRVYNLFRTANGRDTLCANIYNDAIRNNALVQET